VSLDQPMARGVVPGRFESRAEIDAKAAISKVQKTIQEVGQLEEMLAGNPVLKALAHQIEVTAREAYLATEKGKVQMEMLKELSQGVDIDIDLLIRNLRRKLMGSKLSGLIE
jgi:hypothetical protein